MVETWSERHFIFIGGLHRSGTTYVADLLRGSPQVASLTGTGVHMDEGQHLQDVYPSAERLGGSTQWTNDLRFHLVEKDADEVPDAAGRLWAAWQPYLSRAEAPLVVEKSPPNLTRTRFLRRIFPNSSFVIVTRHPFTQALALSKWTDSRSGRLGQHLLSLVDQWVTAHRAFKDDAGELDRLLVLRFEDVMRAPEEAMRGLVDFVGIGDSGIDVPPVDLTRVGDYARRWTQANRPGAILRSAAALPRGVGRHTLAVRDFSDAVVFPHVRRASRRRYGAEIAELGYDLDLVDVAHPWKPAR